MAVDDPPLPVFAPVDLRGTQRHALILTVVAVGVMLELDREREILFYYSRHVLGAPAIEVLGFRRRRKQLPDGIKADLVAADRGHDRHVVGARPQLEERFGISLALLGDGGVTAIYECSELTSRR